MPNNCKLFGFSLPINKLLTITANESAHLFWKDTATTILGANDKQATLFKLSSAEDFTGRDYRDFLSAEETRLRMKNDEQVLKNDAIKLFSETCVGYNCLAVRAPLKNSGNQITGIIGLFFYFHETSFYKAINLINMLNISPCVKSGYTYSYVMNSKVPPDFEINCQ